MGLQPCTSNSPEKPEVDLQLLALPQNFQCFGSQLPSSRFIIGNNSTHAFHGSPTTPSDPGLSYKQTQSSCSSHSWLPHKPQCSWLQLQSSKFSLMATQDPCTLLLIIPLRGSHLTRILHAPQACSTYHSHSRILPHFCRNLQAFIMTSYLVNNPHGVSSHRWD